MTFADDEQARREPDIRRPPFDQEAASEMLPPDMLDMEPECGAARPSSAAEDRGDSDVDSRLVGSAGADPSGTVFSYPELHASEPADAADSDARARHREGPKLAGTGFDEDGESWVGTPLEVYAVGDPGVASYKVQAGIPEEPQDSPPDSRLDDGVVGGLHVRAASCRGLAHRHDGTPRQDDYALCAVDDRWLVVAVADGVSAGALSHHAAYVASRVAAKAVREMLLAADGLDAVDWDDVLRQAARAVLSRGKRLLPDSDPADVEKSMAATLVVAALSVVPGFDGSRAGRIVTVGDTSAFVLEADGTWRLLTKLKNEGATIASSATVALPRLGVERVEPIELRLLDDEGLFVMTDGVGDALDNGRGPVGRFLASVWNTPPERFSFAGQVSFARKTYDDDRTVVGIWTSA